MISSELFWEWVARRRKIISIVSVIIVLLAIYLQQTLVIVTVKIAPNSEKFTPQLTILNKNGIQRNMLKIGTIGIIPRDTIRADATYGNWQTSVDITPLPWIGLKNIAINVEPDRNANKVSGDTLGCVTYDKASTVLASYSCNDPSGLYTYKTPDTDGTQWKSEAYLSFPRAYTVADYKNGLLGISNNSSPQLFYADMTSKSVSLPLIPQGLTTSELANSSIVTDTIGDTGHFLLVNTSSGKVYFATNENNNITYRQFAVDKKWLTGGSLKCALRQSTAYCYAGISTASPDSDDETKDRDEGSDGKLAIINFTSDKVSYSVSSVSKSEAVDVLYIDGNNQLYSLAGTNLYSLDTTKSSVTRKIINQSIEGVSGSTALYFIANNKLYEYDSKTKQSLLRFTSKHLRLSTINQTDSKVFVNAYIDGTTDNKLHTYELQQDQNTTPNKRIIDLLPVKPDSDISPIVGMDINGNRIHIVLPNYVSYDAKGKISQYDIAFNESKREAVKYLSTIVPDVDSYVITYSRASN